MARNLRIITGLLLFAFVASHLSNMALGIISLDWVEASRPYFMAIWSNPVGGNVLLIAILIHLVLGLHALYLRNTLRMSAHDLVQFGSAIIILPLLIPHAWGIVGGMTLLNFKLTFPIMLQLFWIETPLEGLRQVALVVVMWVHACIGLFTWLKLKPWWPKLAPYIYPLAVAIPTLALLGFAEGGNKALELMRAGTLLTPEAADPSVQLDGPTFAANYAFLIKVKWGLLYGYTALLAAILVARYFRLQAIGGIVEIQYDNRWGAPRIVATKAGTSVLEIAIANDIPQAHLCRGRGRCGTCRISVKKTDQDLPTPSELELATLERLGCAPETRLACQLRPEAGNITIEQLVEPDIETLHQNDIVEAVVAQ